MYFDSIGIGQDIRLHEGNIKSIDCLYARTVFVNTYFMSHHLPG